MRFPSARFTAVVITMGLLGGRAAALSNDAFSSAQNLGSAADTLVAFDSGGATRQLGEPTHAGNSSTGTIWWRWTAPSDGLLRLSLPDTSGSDTWAAYTGEDLASLVEVAAGSTGRLEVSVTVGTSYAIVLAKQTRGHLKVQFHPRPANDDFAQRMDLGSGYQWSVSGSTLAATREDGEPKTAESSSAGPSVWWSWQAPEDGIVKFDLVGSDSRNWLTGVYTGDELTSLTQRHKGSAFYTTSAERVFRVVAGEQFAIAAARDSSGKTGDIQINWKLEPQPYHSTPESAVELGSVAEASGIVDTTGASDGTLWWRWTAPANGQFEWSAVPAGGSSAEPETEVRDAAMIAVPKISSNGAYRFRAGTTYLLSVTTSTYSGLVEWSFSSRLAQPNDDLADAVPLMSGANPYDLTYSGVEPGEPVWASNSWDQSLWWEWTALQDGCLAFEIDNEFVRPQFAVWESGGADQPLITSWSGNHEILLPVADGMDLRIGLLTTLSSFSITGPDLLHATFAPLSTGNDDFSAAEDLGSSWDILLFGDTAGATIESGETMHLSGVKASVWWKWTAPGACHIRPSRSFDFSMSVFRGTGLADLVPYPQGALVAAGETLWIAHTAGNAEPNQAFFHPAVLPAPTNDAFATPTNLGSVEQWRERFILDGSSLEEGESHAVAGDSLWWTWTAPRDGNVEIQGSPIWHVYRGDSLATLDLLVSTSETRGAAFAAEAGVSYRIALTGYNSKKVSVFLRMTEIPIGDHYDAPIELGSPVSFYLKGPDEEGTLEDIDRDMFPNADESFWWAWQAAADGWLASDRDPSDGWHLFEEGPLGELLPMADNEVKAGVRYRIAHEHAWWHHDWSTWTFHPALLNDAFSGALDLDFVGGDITLAADLWGATFDAEESALLPEWDTTVSGAAWWSWTAPFHGVLQLSADSYETAVALLEGVDPATMEVLSSSDTSRHSWSSGWVRVEPGHVYRILLGSNLRRSGTSVSLTAHETPVNDHWSQASDLGSSTQVSASGNNIGAVRETSESVHGIGSVWWRWTAPANGNAFVAADLTTGSELLTVYREVQGAAPEAVAVSPARNSSEDIALSFRAKKGEVYLFSVSGPSNSKEGPIQISVTLADPIANDDIANRIVLPSTLPIHLSGSMISGTITPDEPLFGISNLASSLWWSWTPTSNQQVLVLSDGALFAVYRETGPGSFEALAGPTDYPFGWQAEAGVEYHLMIGSTAKQDTLFNLKLEPLDPPENDDFADRIDFGSVAEFYWSGQNFLTTAEPGEPSHAGETAAHSIWFAWTAPTDGAWQIDASGSDQLANLGVYRGNAVDGLEKVAARETSVVFTASAGETFAIAADDRNGRTGSIELTLQATTIPTNDDFADRSLVSSASFTLEGDTAFASVESGEPGAGSDPTRSLWWEWVAPSGNSLRVTRPDFNSTNLSVFYSTSSEPSLSSLRYVFNGTGSFRPSAGRRYFIQVGSRNATGDRFSLVFAPAFGSPPPPPPPNDNFADRIILGDALGITVAGDLYGATPNPDVSGSSSYPSIWWSWTAPASGVFGISCFGVTPSPITIYHEDGPSSPTAIASSNSKVIWFEAIAGETYSIEWRDYLRSRRNSLYRHVAFRILAGELAPNDNYAQAEVLADGWTSWPNGHNLGAGAEPGEPEHGGTPAMSSVWYTWTAEHTGQTRLQVYWATMRAAVYTGDEIATLSEVASGDEPLEFHTVAGQTYRIALDSDTPASFSVRLSEAQPLAINDNFADAIPLSDSPVSAPGSTRGLTLEDGEPIHPESSSKGGSAWWVWTAPADGPVDLTVEGPSSVKLAVYLGDTVESLRPVASGGTRFFAEAGTTYRIAASMYGATTQVAFTLELAQEAPGPPNDLIADAIVLEGTRASTMGNRAGASREAGEPWHDWSTWKNTVWFRWVAPADGLCEVRASGEGPALTAVYHGTQLGSLGLVAVSDTFADSPGSVGFAAKAGQTYSIVVATRYGGSGDAFELELILTHPGGNDAFTDRIPLGPVSSAILEGNVTGTSRETDEPRHASDDESGSLWWSWTAPLSGGVSIDARENLIGAKLAVYQGSALGSLVEVASAGSYSGDALSWFALAGEEYLIVIAGKPANSGLGGFNVALNVSRAPNNAFAARIVLPSTLPAADAVTANGTDRETGDPSGKDSLWWQWTAPTDGLVDVDVSDSEFRAKPWVGVGSALMLLTKVPLAEAGDGIWRFHARAGTVYQIALNPYYSNRDALGLASVKLTVGALAPNDLFADALPVAGDRLTITALSRGAGTEAGEPKPEAVNKTHHQSLWWSWTAPRAGFLQVVTASGNWAYLYQGDRWGDLTEVDGPRGIPGIYQVDAGRTYWLAAGDYEGGEVNVDLVLSPLGDLFAFPVELGKVMQLQRDDSLEGCFREDFEPFHAGRVAQQSFWYRWTAPCDGTMRVGAASDSESFPIAVYTGETIDNLREAGSSASSQCSLEVERGQEYRIVVDQFSRSSPREYRLSLLLDLPGYADWRDGFFGPEDAASAAGPLGDPDRDGRHNLLELTLGSNPLVFDSAAALTFDNWQGLVRLNVRRPAGLTSWWHYFEVSDDLVGWLPTTGLDRLQSITDHGDGTETFHVILTDYSVASHRSLFFRLVGAHGEDPLGP